MAYSHTPASYLPESMFIKLSENIRLFDSQHQSVPQTQALSYFFHEYAHYIHNISTANGIAVFINTLALWRCFRHTIDLGGYSRGSAALDQKRNEHLQKLLANLNAARQKNKPQPKLILSPVSIEISDYKLKAKVQGQQDPLINVILCNSIIKDQGGQTEKLMIVVGTHELLEGAAWILENRVIEAMNSSIHLEPAPIFPYHIAEEIANCAMPNISKDDVLVCLLSALQSSDAPSAFVELLTIAEKAVKEGSDLSEVLRNHTKNAISQNEASLLNQLAKLKKEFNGNGVMAIAVRQIINSAKLGFSLRNKDPFFELTMIEKLRDSKESIKDILNELPSCAVLQRNPGLEDEIGRDHLFSFLSADQNSQQDPEDGLRIIHSIFDYITRHRRQDGFAPTNEAYQGKCPFYTCCNLSLRRNEASLCQNTPWKAADWSGWDQNGVCWYGTGVRITRPP